MKSGRYRKEVITIQQSLQSNIRPVSQEDKERIEKAFAKAGWKIEVTGRIEKEGKQYKMYKFSSAAR